MANPIRNEIVRIVKGALRYPADALLASSESLPRRVDECLSGSSALLGNSYVAAKFYPADAGSLNVAKHAESEPAPIVVPGEKLPFPPEALWEGYGPTLDVYRKSGLEHFRNLKRSVEKHGFRFQGKKRVLDFGCAAGRLIRHFEPWSDEMEIRGVDIGARPIAWCQRHLRPFRFATTTTFPHLPFEDRAFDLIYAGSVFTHISDLADAWLLELRRIARPGGLLYLTVLDNDSIRILRRDRKDYFLTKLVDAYDDETGFLAKGFEMVSLRRSPKDAMVFYDEKYLESTWGRELEWLERIPEAYGYQSAIVVRKTA